MAYIIGAPMIAATSRRRIKFIHQVVVIETVWRVAARCGISASETEESALVVLFVGKWCPVDVLLSS